MISTSRTTKTWSDSPQASKFKADDKQFLSPEDQKKALGDKDIGTVLNELTDPNYVDPSKVQKNGKKDLDKDAFFKLMMAQIKAQDPLSPMDSQDMAAQLAQFTSLEQLYNVNENLQGLKKGQDPMANYQAVNFIGKSVASDSAQVIRAKGDTSHDIRFSLPRDAQTGTISIFDSTGKEQRKITVGNLKSGENKFAWNGVLDDNSSARAGEYTLKFNFKDAAGAPMEAQTKYSGKVTGINYTAQGPILLMGNQSIKLSEIKKIEDAEMKAVATMTDKANKVGVAKPIPKQNVPAIKPELGADQNKKAASELPNTDSTKAAATKSDSPAPIAAKPNSAVTTASATVNEVVEEPPGPPAEGMMTDNLGELAMAPSGAVIPKSSAPAGRRN